LEKQLFNIDKGKKSLIRTAVKFLSRFADGYFKNHTCVGKLSEFRQYKLLCVSQTRKTTLKKVAKISITIAFLKLNDGYVLL